MERITSRANPMIRRIRKLREDRGYRYREGCFLADGIKLLEEALKWNVSLETVLLQEDLPVPAVPSGVRLILVPKDLMAYVSRMETPQGILAVCRIPSAGEFRLTPGTLILDGIQDPGNLGTILRTADALDVPIVLSDGCADPYGEKTVRATMGSIFRNPPVQCGRTEILEKLRAAEISLLVTALSDRAEDIRRRDLSGAALVIGSEGRGVSSFYRSMADGEIVIPMTERCESLNAAVAAAIVMWEMKR